MIHNWLHPTKLHAWRWRFVTLWIILFSVAWIWNIISVRSGANDIRIEASTRKHERDNQLALLATAGHDECVRAFKGMTSILHISIDKKRYAQLSPGQKNKVDQIFTKASPKINCPPSSINKKALKKIRDKGE